MNKAADAKQFAALEAPYRARAQARVQTQANAEALAIAERVEREALEMAHRAEKGVLDREDEAAAELAAAMMAGDKPVEITVGEQLMLASVVAQSRAKLGAKAAAKLREQHAKSLQKLQGTETDVALAVNQIFIDEDLETARQLNFHISEVVRLGKSLMFGSLAGEMHERRPLLPEVSEVLTKLDFPLLNRMEISIETLKYGDPVAFAERDARRAALIAGDGLVSG